MCTVCRQGEYGTEMYFILKGVVEATVSELSAHDMEYLSDNERLQSHLAGNNVSHVTKDVAKDGTKGQSRPNSAPDTARSGNGGVADKADGASPSLHRGGRLGSTPSRSNPSRSRLLRSFSVFDPLSGGDDSTAMPVGLFSDGSYFGQVWLWHDTSESRLTARCRTGFVAVLPRQC